MMIDRQSTLELTGPGMAMKTMLLLALLVDQAVIVFAAVAVAEGSHRYAALPMTPHALVPRYVFDLSKPMVKRDGKCGDGSHDCLDIQHGEQCCDNQSYCYVDKAGKPRCCPIGSNCVVDSACSSDRYQCLGSVTSGITTITGVSGCCMRACPQTSQYLCPSDRGGKCCSYGFDCQADGNCVARVTATPSASLTPIVPGCTTAQTKCADGTGCCGLLQRCTSVSGTGYCAATGSVNGSTVTSNDGLSNGAKAGIGAAVAVVGSAIIGVAAWMCCALRLRQTRPVGSQQRSPDNGQERAAEVADTSETAATSSRLRISRVLPRRMTGSYRTERSQMADTTAPTTDAEAAGSVPPAQMAQPAAEMESSSAVKHGVHESFAPQPCAPPPPPPHPETTEGRFELYGWDASP